MRYPFLLIVAFFVFVASAAEAQAVPNAGVKVVTVVNNSTNPSPKAPSDFQFTIAESGEVPLFSFGGSAQPITVPLTLSAQTTFVLSRVASPAGYATTFGGDCNPDGSVVVQPGSVKACTITQAYLSASESGPSNAVLKIIKIIDADSAIGTVPHPGNFTIRVSKVTGPLVAAVTGSGIGINVGLASSTNNAYVVREDPNSDENHSIEAATGLLLICESSFAKTKVLKP
jgi:hypothetical protein